MASSTPISLSSARWKIQRGRAAETGRAEGVWAAFDEHGAISHLRTAVDFPKADTTSRGSPRMGQERTFGATVADFGSRPRAAMHIRGIHRNAWKPGIGPHGEGDAAVIDAVIANPTILAPNTSHVARTFGWSSSFAAR
jgi:hypothetical protein